MPQKILDEIDRRILAVLQNNARVANVDLARQVGVSTSPCWRRVRELEETGVISRYVTLVDPVALGLQVNIFVQVTLEKQIEAALEQFERAVLARPEVMECYLMTGDADYHLRGGVEDLSAYERCLMDQLTRVQGIANIRSSFALKQVKYTTALPLESSALRG